MSGNDSGDQISNIADEGAQTCANSEKGATISTSTGSYNPLDEHDPKLSKLAANMFEKAADYFNGNLKSTQEEYQLLENMNTVTANKYADIAQIASNVLNRTQDSNEEFKRLKPALDGILALQDKVVQLEDASYKLDSYSKRLEEKYKALERRHNATSKADK